MYLFKNFTGFILCFSMAMFDASAFISPSTHPKVTVINNKTVQSGELEKHEELEGIRLSPEMMGNANIKVTTITPQIQFRSVYAPGEVKANGYKSYIVSPRTESVIINRHAILGEQVDIGQPLVTLFSESMAQAQADYLYQSI